MNVRIKRRSGMFGPNRVHEVRMGQNAFLFHVVGSGAVKLIASVERDGTLSIPHRNAAWIIEIVSTGGGKVTESFSGRLGETGAQASVERHQGFNLARRVFYALWDQWFDPSGRANATAQAVVEAFQSFSGGQLTAPRNIHYPLLGYNAPGGAEDVVGEVDFGSPFPHHDGR